ncbi:MAG TPA: division/cell wall cluster transcriptional repressor MraZ [Bacteroidetes bacterium]|nr:division/cell wall cluster transcriptional repressor MraZ [Bacteroidota bacterium]
MWKTFSHKKWEKVVKSGNKCLILDCYLTTIEIIMYQLLGEFPCKIDSKGRLRLPSGLLDQLPADERDLFVINRGFEGCLNLYPKKVWDEKSAQVKQLNEFDLNSRMFKRAFLNGAAHLKKDGADRLNLPNSLLQYAGIENEALLVGVDANMELWSADKWNEVQSKLTAERFAELAQTVLGNRANSAPAEPQ